MCTYEDLVDATLPHGLIPLVVPQLRTITLGGAVTGLGIESTSFRNGLPHESVLEMDVLTGAGEVVTTTARRGPVRRVPQLLRLPRLRHPAPDRARAGRRRTSTCGTCASTTSTRSPRPSSVIVEQGEHDGDPGRRPRRRGVRAGRGLPDAGHLDATTSRPAGDVSDYTGMDLYYRSLQQRETDTPDDVRLPLALGHRLVLVLGRVRAAEPAGPPAVAAPLAAQRRLPPDRRPGEPLRRRRPHRPAGAASPSASG